jgi:hypothetical protein
MARRLAGLVSIATLLATPLPPVRTRLPTRPSPVVSIAEVNARNIDAFDAFIAPDFVDSQRAPGAPTESPASGGPQGFRGRVPDLKIENDRVIARATT